MCGDEELERNGSIPVSDEKWRASLSGEAIDTFVKPRHHLGPTQAKATRLTTRPPSSSTKPGGAFFNSSIADPSALPDAQLPSSFRLKPLLELTESRR